MCMPLFIKPIAKSCFRKRHAIMHFGVAHLQLNQWKTRVDGLEWECKLCSPPITPRQSLEQIGK